ncbi:MAG: ParB N-terminal domain-containing protein [Synergistaceae bacterium]|nr:ParB N-terminal domain-containing protein [Synergistaceae bacterium]
MEVRNIAVKDIREYANNPRNISENAIKAVAESIKVFGFRVPIILDRDNVIVAGHTRIQAARLLGLDEVPCVVADDLTPEQVRAFRLADNKVAELSGWDFEKLDLELEELADVDIDMSGFGFDIDENVSDHTDFFVQAEPNSDEQKHNSAKPHRITCPECGAEIQIDEV